MPRMVICKECGEEKPHMAHGLCSSCYMSRYNRDCRGQTKVICKECGEEKPHTAFGLCRSCYNQSRKRPLVTCASCGEEKGHYAKGLCKNCYSRQCYDAGRRQNLKTKYGITLADYDEMLEAQNGGCWICGKTQEENGMRLAVDHDHKTGKVRGLLCFCCNSALGKFQDDTLLLARAIEYLTK